MIAREMIGQLCGVVVIIYSVLSPQLPKRWQILLLASVGNFFAAANQLLVGSGLTACFACLLASIHCPISAYKDKKGLPTKTWENIFWSVLYIAAWAAGFFIGVVGGTASPLDLMTLATTIFFIGHVLSKDENRMRLFYLGNSGVFMIYDIINLNITAIAKGFSVVSALIALYRYRKKKTSIK